MISLIQTGELILRKIPFELPELIALFVCIALIGLAKISHPKTLETAFGTLFSLKTEISFNDTVKMHPLGSFVLIINFLVSVALLTFLSTQSLINDNSAHYLFSVGIAALLLFLYLTGIYIVGFISGEMNRISTNQIFTLNFIHISGIVGCFLAIPWLINPHLNIFFTITTGIILAGLYLLRLFKILSVALREHIPLYYLFLYLCTLEILPVFVCISVFWKNVVV
jgi:hypothetical protein